MKKRMMTSIATIIATCVLLAGCGAASDTGKENQGEKTAAETQTPAKSEGPVTIRVATNKGDISDDEIIEFEQNNPDINIEWEDLDQQKLAAQLATDDAPDLIRVQGAVDLTSFVVKGLALDLTPYLEKSQVLKEDDFLPPVNLYRFDGKVQGQGPIYGMPKDWSPDFTIFYNKKLFEAAGVEVPDSNTPLTWNELMELGKKLTLTENGKVKQYGFALGSKTQADLQSIMLYLASKGVKIFSEDMQTVDFTKPEVKEAVSMWVDAVKNNLGKNDVNQDPAPWGGDLFINNKAAMIMAGYWFSGLIRGDEKMKTHLEDYGMLAAPIAENGERVSPTGAATGFMISKNTKYPEQAWKVFEFVMGGTPAKNRATAGWGVPALKSLLPLMPQQTDFDKRVYNQLQEELKYSNTPLESNPFFLNGQTILDKYVTPVYFGKANLDDALKELTKNANLIIQESMNAAQ
ncbi:ABC transporter substrate-binding protein [Cohnella sp.]|uniref:ABC transporter substrate-binding protein n=1 Tax=Cohnella sp. TaxID=1883426 RepID=UPI0035690D9A